MKLGSDKRGVVKNKIKSVKTSADESLAKLRDKKWSKKLGKTLGVTSKIVTMIGRVVPGAIPVIGIPIGAGFCILGSLLSMGATLLNPKPNLKDLEKDLNEMKQELNSITETDEERKADKRDEIKEMEEKIATSISETRSDLEMIHIEMLKVKKDVRDGNGQTAKELSKIKDRIMETLEMVEAEVC